jgi:hypothetical protein
MNEPFTFPERDERGRFVHGNSFAARGGQARARKLPPDRRQAIARKGFQALVTRRFDGDRQAAINWLTAKGHAANDQHYAPELRKFQDPGPMPGGK